MEYEQPQLDIEIEHEFVIICGLGPKRDCPGECKLHQIMKSHFSSEARRSGQSYPHFVESLRDPGNEEYLENFRMNSDRILKRVTSFCEYYPESDINYTQEDKNLSQKIQAFFRSL